MSQSTRRTVIRATEKNTISAKKANKKIAARTMLKNRLRGEVGMLSRGDGS